MRLYEITDSLSTTGKCYAIGKSRRKIRKTYRKKFSISRKSKITVERVKKLPNNQQILFLYGESESFYAKYVAEPINMQDPIAPKHLEIDQDKLKEQDQRWMESIGKDKMPPIDPKDMEEDQAEDEEDDARVAFKETEGA